MDTQVATTITEDPLTLTTIIGTLQKITQLAEELTKRLQTQDSIISLTTAPATASVARIQTASTSGLNSTKNTSTSDFQLKKPLTTRSSTSSLPKSPKVNITSNILITPAKETKSKLSTTVPRKEPSTKTASNARKVTRQNSTSSTKKMKSLTKTATMESTTNARKSAERQLSTSSSKKMKSLTKDINQPAVNTGTIPRTSTVSQPQPSSSDFQFTKSVSTNTDLNIAMIVNKELAQSATSTNTPISQISPHIVYLLTKNRESPISTSADTVTYTQTVDQRVSQVSTAPTQELATLPPTFAQSISLPETTEPPFDTLFPEGFIDQLLQEIIFATEEVSVPTTMSLPTFQTTFQRSAMEQQDVAASSSTATQPTTDQLSEVQELLRTANKITPNERDTVISFMTGSRLNPNPQLGNIISIQLSETIQNVLPNKRIIEKTYILLNYKSGQYKKIKNEKIVED